jgi:hypothetical protein
MRIRLHVNKAIIPWDTHEELLYQWIQKTTSLLSALGASFYCVRDPLSQSDQTLLASQVSDTAMLRDYTLPLNNDVGVGTMDFWCGTSYESWGESLEAFQYAGPESSAYFDFLSRNRLVAEVREKFPFGYCPCVALSGSTQRDNDTKMQKEFMDRLSLYDKDIPPFVVAWMSLRCSLGRPISVKCIATTCEHFVAMIEHFRRLEMVTVRMELFHTRHLQMHFLELPRNASVVQQVQSAQEDFDKKMTRVTLRKIPQLDPFVVSVPPHPGRDDDRQLTIAQFIFQGGVYDTTEELIENPVLKLTTDSSFECYYLYAPVEEAEALIRFGHALQSVLTARFGWEEGCTELRTKTATTALPSRRGRKHATTVSFASSDPTEGPSAQTHTDSDYPQMIRSLHQMVLELQTEVLSIRSTLESHRVPAEVLSAVQSSITSTVTDLQAQNYAQSEALAKEMKTQFHTYTSNLGTICHELNATQVHDHRILSDLLDRYDYSTTAMTDGFLAYGNELVMLRLMIQACVDRINLLISGSPNIPDIPFGSPHPRTPRDGHGNGRNQRRLYGGCEYDRSRHVSGCFTD